MKRRDRGYDFIIMSRIEDQGWAFVDWPFALDWKKRTKIKKRLSRDKYIKEWS